jgi:hypothetical protein
MSTISPLGQRAIVNGFGRVERGAQDLIESLSGQPDKDPANAIAQIIEGEAQAKAGVGIVRIADQMLEELLKIGQESEAR